MARFFRRRRFRRRFSRRRAVRPITNMGTGRWERAHISAGQGTFNFLECFGPNIFTSGPIIQLVSPSIFQDAAIGQTQAQILGRALDSTRRRIEVGWLDANFHVWLGDFAGEPGASWFTDSPGIRNTVLFQWAVYSDRILANGNPATPQGFLDFNSFPINTQPTTSAEDYDYPTRIHRRNSAILHPGAGQIGTVTTSWRAQGRIAASWHQRIPIKRWYGDVQGLYLTVGARTQPDWFPIGEETRYLQYALTGSLWWRARF